VVALVFSSPHTDFTERDRAVLNLVRPHLAKRGSTPKSKAISVHCSALPVTPLLTVVRRSSFSLIHRTNSLPSMMTLYRFYGRPSKTGSVSSKVERWIADQEARLESPDRLELSKPLGAEIDARRMVLRYLPAGRLTPLHFSCERRGESPEPRHIRSDGARN